MTDTEPPSDPTKWQALCQDVVDDAMSYSEKCLEDSRKPFWQSPHLKIILKGEEQFEKESRAQGQGPEAESHDVWEVVLGRT